MCAKWNNSFQHNQVTDRIEEIKTVSDGKVTFKAFEYKEYEAILESMVQFHSEVPNYLKRGFIWEGVKNAALRKITTKSLISAISKKEREFLSKEKRPYLLYTQVSINNNTDIQNVKLPKAFISFYKHFPQKIAQNRFEHEKRAKSFLKYEENHKSMKVRIRINARDEHEASNIALESLDFYRALLNYLLTSTFRYSFGGPSKPLNVVMLGAVHTLHNLNGSLATDLFWYQPEYQTVKNINIRSKQDDLVKSINYIRQRIKSLVYKDKLYNILIRYVRSMDYTDYNTAFIQLWGVLEALTNTKNKSYDTTINRAITFYEDYDYHKQVLNHLRFHRNNIVHNGVAFNDIEPYIYQLKRYVDKILKFVIDDPFDFNSFDRIIEFMDTPHDKLELNKRLSLIKTAIMFRK